MFYKKIIILENKRKFFGNNKYKINADRRQIRNLSITWN